jgi:hypothetical protein
MAVSSVFHIVTRRLKTGTGEPGQTSVARQRLGNHSRGNKYASNKRRTDVSVQRRAKHTSVTIEELLENGVFCGSAPKLCNEDLRQLELELRESLEMVVE